MVSNNSEHRATLRQWQLFILTVEKGSILAASAAANTDAAVVSREITKLEHLLQEPLLERSRSGVRPTWLGAQKYKEAIKILHDINTAFSETENTSIRSIDKFLSPDVPLKAIVFDYYMNFIPYFANLFSPLFTFIAVIFFTSKLADNSEVIAMLASGMSFRRLMLPYAISAGIIALSTFVLNAYIIPPANATRIDFQNKYIKNKKVDYVRSAQLEIEPGVIAYFDRYDARSGMGYRFSLEHFEDKKMISRLTANSIKYDSLYN